MSTWTSTWTIWSHRMQLSGKKCSWKGPPPSSNALQVVQLAMLDLWNNTLPTRATLIYWLPVDVLFTPTLVAFVWYWELSCGICLSHHFSILMDGKHHHGQVGCLDRPANNSVAATCSAGNCQRSETSCNTHWQWTESSLVCLFHSLQIYALAGPTSQERHQSIFSIKKGKKNT